MTARSAPLPIVVRGARQNNLQGIDVDVPRRRLTVVTGVSGSGKSSLAMETLYAEGQRRYVASLSTYAQQFLDRLPRPDVDAIRGLPPAVAIEQANPTLNRRSTVGTATEIYDHLRLLFARAGTALCPGCAAPVRSWSPTAVADVLAAEPAGSDWSVTFALPVSDALTHDVLVDNLRALGFVRLLAAGRELHLEELPASADLTRAAPLFVIADRVRVGRTPRPRVVEAVERAYAEGEGEVVLFPSRPAGVGHEGDGGGSARGTSRRFSRHSRCDGCGSAFPELRPTLFSFNSPYGACAACSGFGNLLEFDLARIVPRPDRSLAEGAIDPWTKPRYSGRRDRLRAFARETGLAWKAPWAELPAEARDVLVHGGRYRGHRFEGAIPFLEGLTRKKYKAYIRFFLRGYQSYRICPECAGSRLRREATAVQVAGRSLPEVVGWPLPRLADWLAGLSPEAADAPAEVIEPILRELKRRAALLLAVGLEYLTLDRLTRTLSGGEAQRIAIANALGSPLTDGLYVLDEPSVGLHPRDIGRVIDLLHELTERGNTVVVVEHDLAVIGAADSVVELGPGSGERGGSLVFAGSPDALREADTLTGAWLRGEARLPDRASRLVDGPWLVVRGARAHNLQGIDVAFPLRALTAVTGVSGSGKSTLVHDVLYRALADRFGAVSEEEGGAALETLDGVEWLTGVVLVDQSPIGKSPRSNPVTYVKAFDPIRRLFAETPAARRRGFTAAHFSFNTADGRCSACRGDGHQRIEMHFLPDVFVTCEECRGRRYRREILTVQWRARSIADVLDLTVDGAIAFFAGEPAVGRGLRVLQSVGLGYLRLGQPATTLSGGESQRLKIARELAHRPGRRRGARGVLYLLDEPTTGLHNADIRALVRVLDGLVARGNTVIVIEHHLDVVARADWVVDLGPEGGHRGGRVVAVGPPEEIAGCDESHTGRVLRERVVVPEALSA